MTSTDADDDHQDVISHDADEAPTEAEDSSTSLVPAGVMHLQQLASRQDELAEGFERLAHSVTPLLTSQYEATLVRVRVLEQRILQRQERPTVVKLAQLLTSAARLQSSEDKADHFTNGVLQVLEGLGYEQFGVVGAEFDESQHDALDGVECASPVVTKVHALGLRAGDDVIIRARVEVGLDSELEGLESAWEGPQQ